MLMPAVELREAESNQFQLNFIICGGIRLIFDILTDSGFLSKGDNNLKRYLIYMYMWPSFNMTLCML